MAYQPSFRITNHLLTYISRIETAKAMIDNAPLIPAWEAKFRTDAMTRSVHYGTKIEGNNLSQTQTEQVVRLGYVDSPAQVTEKTGIIARERDIQEVLNYRSVIAWVDTQSDVKIDKVYTQDTLKTIHKLTVANLIAPEYAGNYRDRQVVVQSATDNRIVFRPPVAMEVPFLVEDFMAWALSPATQDLHAIIRAAITHYQIVFIHPFIEGNGRTARAMATLALYSLGYDFKKFFSLDQYFDSDVEAYYQALLSVQQTSEHDLTYWLEYFCYGLAMEIDKIQSQVLRLSKDLKLKRQLGKQVAISERQIIILELFSHQDEVTSEDIQLVLPNVSVDTILRDVKDLIAKGVIEKFGVTKGVRYKLAG